ncbi:MAG: malate synthase G, partial [Gammaproteobacteria bacterium]
MSNREKGRREVGNLRIDTAFFDFVEKELLPAIAVEPTGFWAGFESLIDELTPVNRELLDTRDVLQARIDEWHLAHPGRGYDHAAYVAFLESISYLQESGEDFTIGTANVDMEIAEVAGPQLVVPVSNARFALNAANARWGSLYDALYGTDVISEDEGREREGPYNPTRGCAVIRYTQDFLDRAIPLDGASHTDVSDYGIAGSEFVAAVDGKTVGLTDASAFRGYARDGDAATYLFVNHGLHIEIQTNPQHPIGREAAANVADVV